METDYMQIQEENNLILVKFNKGEIIKNLSFLMEKKCFDSALVISGIGMLKNITIGYFNGDTYVKEQIKDPVELVSLQGNISRVQGRHDVMCHLHVAVADQNHQLKGGHLIGGEVSVVNEILLTKLDAIKIRRKKNKQGLFEMTLHKNTPKNNLER
jgi:predicted DNA-binding protein with PD1-like motif